MAFDVTGTFFAVLYVSIMGLTRCYKTKVFNIYICSFSTEFILRMYIIAQTHLRFCKNKQKPYWNTTSGFDFGESAHWRRSYDVTKIFKMAAVDGANQLPVPDW